MRRRAVWRGGVKGEVRRAENRTVNTNGENGEENSRARGAWRGEEDRRRREDESKVKE